MFLFLVLIHIIYKYPKRRESTINSTRALILGGLCVCLAVILQLIPVFFGENFVLITILSTIPIYIISRLNTKMGCIVFFISGLIISEVSFHEGLFFLFANGLVGVSLGLGSYYFKRKGFIVLLGGISLFFALMILNFVLGISVFGVSLPGTFFIKLSIILIFSLLYCYFYLNICNYIYRKINCSLRIF